MPGQLYLLIIFLFLGLFLVAEFGCNPVKNTEKVTVRAVNPNANEDVNRVLGYLITLPEKSDNRIISGQNCCHGNEIIRCFDAYVQKLHDQTGYWPGMIGVDYEYTHRFTIDQLHECNQYLIDYWNKGGLITINWAPHNPWTDNGTRDYG